MTIEEAVMIFLKIARLNLETMHNKQLNDLTDSDLADLLLDEVWGPMSSLTSEATLVGQAYDRLKRSTRGPLLKPMLRLEPRRLKKPDRSIQCQSD